MSPDSNHTTAPLEGAHNTALDDPLKHKTSEITNEEVAQRLQQFIDNESENTTALAEGHRTLFNATNRWPLNDAQHTSRHSRTYSPDRTKTFRPSIPFAAPRENKMRSACISQQCLEQHEPGFASGGALEGPCNSTPCLPPSLFRSDKQSKQQDTLQSEYKSKKEKRRAGLEASGIEYGADLKAKGNVAKIDGAIYVRYREEFQPAVYHADLRAEMIAQNPPDRYLHPPARGVDDLDLTSFWPSHATWGFQNRDDRPDILFEFLPTERRAVRDPGVMRHNGRIVIDQDGHPIRDWSVPACLSSEVEPGRLEAMYRESGNKISKQDFRARMPPLVPDGNGGHKAVVTLTAIGMRRIRFRDLAGLFATDPRQGSKARKKALIQCYPPETLAEVLMRNSTRCFRDLTMAEIAYVDTTNRGANPEKAGGRALSKDQRKLQQARKDGILENFEPPNPTAWPYDGDMDDKKAVAVAREFLGFSPVDAVSPGDAGLQGSDVAAHKAAISDTKAKHQRPAKHRRDDEDDCDSGMPLTRLNTSHGKRTKRKSCGNLPQLESQDNVAEFGDSYDLADFPIDGFQNPFSVFNIKPSQECSQVHDVAAESELTPNHNADSGGHRFLPGEVGPQETNDRKHTRARSDGKGPKRSWNDESDNTGGVSGTPSDTSYQKAQRWESCQNSSPKDQDNSEASGAGFNLADLSEDGPLTMAPGSNHQSTQWDPLSLAARAVSGQPFKPGNNVQTQPYYGTSSRHSAFTDRQHLDNGVTWQVAEAREQIHPHITTGQIPGLLASLPQLEDFSATDSYPAPANAQSQNAINNEIMAYLSDSGVPGYSEPLLGVDHRFSIPTNDAEESTVSYYMAQSEADFSWYLGEVAPSVAFLDTSYMERWTTLQRWLEERWPYDSAAPQLWLEDPWMDRWPDIGSTW
ncbi:MAG: hypothetical protein Q9181_005284 [Wetmoreana brouardii]